MIYIFCVFIYGEDNFLDTMIKAINIEEDEYLKMVHSFGAIKASHSQANMQTIKNLLSY